MENSYKEKIQIWKVIQRHSATLLTQKKSQSGNILDTGEYF